MKIYSLCLPCSKSLITYAQIKKHLVSIISLGGEKLQINEKPIFIWVLMFFILYHFWAFSRMAHYLQLFFQVFNNAFFMKKIQDSYWKKTIDKKKKRSKETQPTFFNIKALFSVDTNKLHYFPTTIWTKVVTF